MKTRKLRGEIVDAEQEKKALVEVPSADVGPARRRKPAKLPTYSQAAAAQRLGDTPEPPAPGVFYDVPQTPLHEQGWYLKRHLKRKNLRGTNARVAATSRTGMRSMITLGVSFLSVFLVAIIIL